MTPGPRPRFSSRLAGDLESNPLTSLLAARRAAGQPVTDLTGTNPTRVGLGPDPDALRSILAAADASGYTPDPAGARHAREAVASYYADRGAIVDPGRILLTASTSEGYAYAMKLLLDPGDTLLVPRPSYPLFEHLAALEGAECATYPVRYTDRHGWVTDPDAVWGSLTPRTRAVAVVSPNNPTGSFLKPAEWEGLSAGCAERGLALVADEVFHDHRAAGFTGEVADPARGGPGLTLVLNGLSKTAGLPQLKLGWMLVTGPGAASGEAFRRLEFIADAYLSVSAPVQLAAPALLNGRHAFLARVRERVEANEAMLRRTVGSALRRREGGWSAVVDLPPGLGDDTFVQELLETDGVLVHPGYFYDFDEDGVVVLSLLPTPGEFGRGAGALAARAGLAG